MEHGQQLSQLFKKVKRKIDLWFIILIMFYKFVQRKLMDRNVIIFMP